MDFHKKNNFCTYSISYRLKYRRRLLELHNFNHLHHPLNSTLPNSSFYVRFFHFLPVSSRPFSNTSLHQQIPQNDALIDTIPNDILQDIQVRYLDRTKKPPGPVIAAGQPLLEFGQADRTRTNRWGGIIMT